MAVNVQTQPRLLRVQPAIIGTLRRQFTIDVPARITPLPMENDTVTDMNNLRHMLGVGSHIPKKQWGYRNYFNAGEGHFDMPSLKRLEAAGLVFRGRRPEYWHATEAGYAAIGLPLPKKPK